MCFTNIPISHPSPYKQYNYIYIYLYKVPNQEKITPKPKQKQAPKWQPQALTPILQTQFYESQKTTP